MKKYIMHCGCKGIKREDMLKTNVGGVATLKCPNHSRTNQGRVKLVVFPCKKCGEILSLTFKEARNRLYCSKCSKKRNRKSHHAKKKKPAKKRIGLEHKDTTVEKRSGTVPGLKKQIDWWRQVA